jgi:hypothetical protein
LLLRAARLLLLGLALGPATARADAATTRESLDRLDELLSARFDDGRLDRAALSPAVLVSAQPRAEADRAWFTTAALSLLQRNLGEGALRLCEACMAPRAWVEPGSLRWQAGPISLDEVVALDGQTRGTAAPARAAVWLDEVQGGVSIRVVDLRNGRVVYAENVDPNLVERANSRRTETLAAELERRARGDGLTQSFVDFALFPGQHLSLDWTDQWGERNDRLSGVTFSLFDPVLGVGAVHYRSVEVLDSLVGAKLVMSVPTAAVRALDGSDNDVIDPLLSLVGVVRVPFGRSNYGALLTASTNGQIGFGISLMNLRFSPVIP